MELSQKLLDRIFGAISSFLAMTPAQYQWWAGVSVVMLPVLVGWYALYRWVKQGLVSEPGQAPPAIDSLRKTHRPMGNFDHIEGNAIPPPSMARVSSGQLDRSIRQPKPQLLVIEPNGGTRLWSLGLLASGCASMVMGVVGLLHGHLVFVIGVLVGAFFAAIGGLLGGTKSCFFDRTRGTLTMQRLRMRKTTRRLAEILAVQLLDGGEHGNTESGTYHTFELNLVFNDAEKSRLNLSNHTDLAWTYAAGDQLARFLGVPLFDHLDGPRTMPSA